MQIGRAARVVGIGLLLPLLAAAPAMTQRRPRVSVHKRFVRPSSLSGAGGDVRLSVTVRGRNVDINSVRARGEVLGGPVGNAVTLNRRGDVYTGTVVVPRNTQTRRTRASIVLYVDTTGGLVQRVIARLPMGPGDDSLPPPPPPVN